MILAVSATLLSVSCGGRATSPSKTMNSVAGLVFNTESLDFGAVAVGGSRKSSIIVTNSSPADGGSVPVTKILVTGAGFSLVAPSGGFSLTPGQSATITVNFAPKVAGDALGQLSIVIAGTPETSDVSLTGTTISGNQLVVSPARLNFGGVALGSSKTLSGNTFRRQFGYHDFIRQLERSGFFGEWHRLSGYRACKYQRYFQCQLRSAGLRAN